ncbi:MAG TPA: L-seryl-tRNA(Sec) selenium transferase [Gemmatimonadaceae bacterium]
MMTTDPRRSLPSVSTLLESPALRSLLERAPRSVVVDAVRRTIESARATPESRPSSDEQWAAAVSSSIDAATRPSLRPVLNGTGVVLHTNLGRAPLAAVAIEAIARVASGFSNLELDLETGERGSRYVHCAALLRELTGAEDAIVVNNGAAALVLALDTLARGREAIVSRGELVEIGGSFRVPDIMAKSGARLVEVGTTNRTHLDDYRRAVGAETAAIVKVHRSNFAMEGFVAEADVSELAALAAERRIPLIHDLGSGLLQSLADYGLTGEPTARDAVRAGATLVTMSGDKLAGGPQAGIMLGSREVIDALRKNPLARAFRVDKLTLAALEATLALYRDPPRALREIPALAQLTAPLDTLRARAARIIQRLSNKDRAAIMDSEASVGGGAFPTATIPSVAIALTGHAAELAARLRAGDPPLLARVADGRVLVDVRTILPAQDDVLVGVLDAVLR